MNKNQMDKVLFGMIVLILLVSLYVGMEVLDRLHTMSFTMGQMTERLNVLEEQNPL